MSHMNTTALAYIGDAVYEVYIRKHVLSKGSVHVDVLHQKSVEYVRADGQAAALKRIFDRLTPDEQALVKRARNHKSSSRPKSTDPVTYKWATAMEALVGYLYIENQSRRLDEIMDWVIREIGHMKNEEKNG
ncbi:MAG: ribonuclease III [Clostridia bacterium]|jgi:ribonuclease-3 family protein|nr:ribonuclease III [Clostridia bacterium]